ncbi:methylated-DNA/protein-cysteine methyltransferase [Caldicellulosiruptor hydrothermalis 108]|uniref:Methylated-DNA--protein-cysteine methyltransferase n=1 Tax=Caldicellulosiruptor hydrothermalis (strain DSM 18901 / VKM B-2411 / 108) TaxID=632292 RepID=E4Q7Z8_CALH1|nr:methylated-DNA--[protein]-cysteine S-methyltransferase [Caldicellulosiruptor hydrothermalis]ADQ07916.1 methylated-DNA/protein-cysteine methyltransferase [Caldicellulosiruptor hydrothermalis 108]
MKKSVGYLLSPIGLIKIVGQDDSIVSVEFVSRKDEGEVISPVVREAILQLEEYFEGKRTTFELKLQLQGTEFQKRVWNELIKVHFGSVISYRELAKKVGKLQGARAVGNAVGKNPAVIIVPCHRVVKSDLSLGGFSGGLEKKIWLLSHEGWKIENGLLRK